MFRHLILFSLPALAAAQSFTPRMTAPVLGYTFDESARAIRLISGVPGAANLDKTIASGLALDSALVHSRGRLAIANGKDGGVVLADWNGEPRFTPLESALGRVTLAAFSRSGAWVAISDGTSLELWSGLRSRPARWAGWSPEDGVAAVAVSEEGLVAAATRTGAAVVLAGGPMRLLAAGVAASGLAFMPNGEDLLAVDAGARNLVLIREIRRSPVSSVVAVIDQEPGAVAVSSDGTAAALALGEDLAAVNLAGGRVRAASCECRVERFDALEGNLVFRATHARTGAPMIVDLGGPEPMAGPAPEMGGAIQ
jgi:hypothetical protein